MQTIDTVWFGKRKDMSTRRSVNRHFA